MVIRFLCPNGHQLTAPETLAGKAGKCPKCGLAFAVPTLEEIGAAEAEQTPAETPKPQGEEPQPESQPEAEPSSSQASGSVDLNLPMNPGSAKSDKGSNVFVFLCPNGHKLNGPPSLKGKAGQCPHCGAKFRIPSDEDLADEEPHEEVPESEIPAEEPLDAEIADELPEVAADETGEPEYVDGPPPEEEVFVDPPPDVGHALGYVFARLWDQRYEGTEVELYLKDGGLLAPEFYCDNLSCREYAVFANRNGDEDFSFTLINWDDVRKVIVKKIPTLPRPMFR